MGYLASPDYLHTTDQHRQPQIVTYGAITDQNALQGQVKSSTSVVV
jgi:hypothetical protein